MRYQVLKKVPLQGPYITKLVLDFHVLARSFEEESRARYQQKGTKRLAPLSLTQTQAEEEHGEQARELRKCGDFKVELVLLEFLNEYEGGGIDYTCSSEYVDIRRLKRMRADDRKYRQSRSVFGAILASNMLASVLRATTSLADLTHNSAFPEGAQAQQETITVCAPGQSHRYGGGYGGGGQRRLTLQL